ncbi:MAG: hypothetical protein IK098_00915 [Bacteroidales bacterium]|nr:hypothetical protein [Bacteroidales bacterium]
MKRFSLPLLALALCLFGCTPKENPTPTPTPDPKPDPPAEQVVPAKVTLNETSVSLTGEESKAVTFTSATDWKAAVASDGSSWLTVSPASGSAGTTSVTVKAKANPTYDERKTTFTITGTGKDGSTSTGTVQVTQAATLGMVVEQKAFEVPASGGTVTVKVKANTDYTYTIDSSGQGWITETTTRALTEYVHTFKVDANDQYDSRQGTITFKNTKTGETDQVTITQGALLGMIVEQKIFEVAETGGSITVTVKANTEYDYVISESCKEWITESTTRGLTEYTHTFKIAPNDQYDERIGVITFRDTKTGATEEVQVKQASKGGISPEFEAERAALMAIFNALDGPNWESHEYWGTEAPVTWWPNILCDENGHVVSLNLSDPGIKGSLPPEIGNLPYLTDLNMGGPYVDCHFTGSLPEEIGNLTNLKRLQMDNCPFEGRLPESLGNLSNLEWLYIARCEKLAPGPIPSWIGNLTKLKFILIYGHNFTGQLPESIGNLTNLENLDIKYCSLDSTVPASFGNLKNLKFLRLSENGNLHGPIPASLSNIPDWWLWWPQVLFGNRFTQQDVRDSNLPAPKGYRLTASDGSTIDFDALRSANKYTLLHSWHVDFAICVDYMNTLRNYYNQLPSGELAVLGCMPSNRREQAPEDFENARTLYTRNEIPWKQYFDDLYSDNRPFGLENGEILYPDGGQNEVIIFQGDKAVCTSLATGNPDDCLAFIADEYNLTLQFYESTDYSQDGKVETLQTAKEGNGIDLVVMGDGFSDRLIADGTYRKALVEAVEGFFSEEPMASFRNLFNVYLVNVVSQNEEFSPGAVTALGSFFTPLGDACGGFPDAVKARALGAISEERIENATCITVLNRMMPAGHAYMLDPEAGNELGGAGVAFVGLGSGDFGGHGDVSMAELVLHEAAGHAFGKLADEYYYYFNGPATPEILDYLHQVEKYGWYKNIDSESSPTAVKWAKFLADPRYAGEHLGVYEGANLCLTGMYRPTEDSMMNSNKGKFNAPSREAIYYRIHKLAYGTSWKYDYETFVKWDAKNR